MSAKSAATNSDSRSKKRNPPRGNCGFAREDGSKQSKTYKNRQRNLFANFADHRAMNGCSVPISSVQTDPSSPAVSTQNIGRLCRLTADAANDFA